MKPLEDKQWQDTRQQVLIHRQFFRKLYDIINFMHKHEYPPHIWDQIVHDLIPEINKALKIERYGKLALLLSTFNDVKKIFLRIEEQRRLWFYLERRRN